MESKPPLTLAPRNMAAHKGSFGRALFVGGSRGMSGSIALSSMAALGTGAGLVTAAVPDQCLETVAGFHPCVMTVPMPQDEQGRFALGAAQSLPTLLQSISAIGAGPGMTTQPGSLQLVDRLLGVRELPCVLDADALNCLSTFSWCERRDNCSPLVLTPHPGELERLTGVSAKDRERQIIAAQQLATDGGAVIVVKGAPTVVVSPAGKQWTNNTGNPGMATAGSGDVLTGVITSLLAQGLSDWDAAKLGVWVHGRAGDIAAEKCGQTGMTAAEICASLPCAIASVVEES